MTSIIHAGVRLPEDAEIGPFCVIGQPFSGMDESEAVTIFGAGMVIRSHGVIYAGNKIGVNFQTGHHVFIRELNVIGDNVSLGTLSVIEHHTSIGHGVRLHTQVFIPEYSVIEDNAWIGPNVVLTNAPYPRGKRVKETLVGPRIERNARIGANATVLPGIVIGRGALVGAGSVVTHDVPEYAVVAGNPARVRGCIFDLRYANGDQVYDRDDET